MFSIRPDMRSARAYLNRLETRDLPRVIGRSLDRTGASTRTFFSRRLRERLALKKSIVDAGIKIRRSSEIQNLTALKLGRAYFDMIVSGKPIPLRDFQARQTRRGVTYRVSPAAGRKHYAALGQLAFVVERLGGHVFVRKGPEPTGPEKIGIRKVFGPALPQYLHSKREQAQLAAYAAEFWARELERNARFALARRGA